MKLSFYKILSILFNCQLFILLIISSTSFSQVEKQYKIGCIAFYNLENLFDTLDTDKINDTEFTPSGPKKWNSARYFEKLNNMADVISQIGSDLTKEPPAIIGVSEIENKEVLEDLVKCDKLIKYNYKIVHYHSPDRRGVDVALLYRPEYFKVTNSVSAKLKIAGMDDFLTRDQLVVSGKFNGEKMHFIVNHWPSRRGGEKRSRPLRNAAGDLSRSLIDSILNTDAQAKIILMGDLNDDPVNSSLKEHLKATDDSTLFSQGYLFNAMLPLYKKGIGSLAYKDSWNLFDQMVLTPAFIGSDKSSFKFYKAKVFNKNFLEQKDGRFKGYPFRTYVGNTYMGGYSDHFPVYIYLIKEL
ncbi:MAG: endonuclease/exonuclease/phosphatase family protein [Bacteroidota bacterium]